MPIYSKVIDDATHGVIQSVMERYHSELDKAGVRLDVLMAHPTLDANDDPTGPAIVVNGYPAMACIKILPHKQRVSRGFDAELTLDFDRWESASDEERAALVDHELTHLELALNDKGEVKWDYGDRPKLRMRKHDRQLGWFDSVAHRHGEASFEVQQCRQFLASQEYRQCYLFEMEPVETEC